MKIIALFSFSCILERINTLYELNLANMESVKQIETKPDTLQKQEPHEAQNTQEEISTSEQLNTNDIQNNENIYNNKEQQEEEVGPPNEQNESEYQFAEYNNL